MTQPQATWTEGEIERALDLRANGKSNRDIATELGRSLASVQQKFIRHDWTPEQKAERLKFEKARRWSQRKAKRNEAPYIARAAEPVNLVMVERERRLSAPVRDLTAAFFGDPPVGFSALERRA